MSKKKIKDFILHYGEKILMAVLVLGGLFGIVRFFGFICGQTLDQSILTWLFIVIILGFVG